MGTNQKLTAKQKAERIKAAQEREAREKAPRAAARTKRFSPWWCASSWCWHLASHHRAFRAVLVATLGSTDNAPVPECCFP